MFSNGVYAAVRVMVVGDPIGAVIADAAQLLAAQSALEFCVNVIAATCEERMGIPIVAAFRVRYGYALRVVFFNIAIMALFMRAYLADVVLAVLRGQ